MRGLRDPNRRKRCAWRGRRDSPALLRGVIRLDTSFIMDLWNGGGIPLLMAAYIYYQGKLHREEVDKLSTALSEQTKAVVDMTAKVEIMLSEYIDSHKGGESA